MATVKVFDQKNKEVGKMDLPDSVFGVEPNESLVHQVVVAQLAGRRRGTAHTKTKAEVRGGGKKPFKQKGTGRARQGSSRSPLMPGGGTAFGPRKRSYEQKVNKKMAAGAMRSVLSDKLKADRLIILDNLELAEAKTKNVVSLVSKTFGMNKALLIDHSNTNVERAAQNLPKVKFLRTEGINVYDAVNYEWLVVSKRAAEVISEKLSAKSEA